MTHLQLALDTLELDRALQLAARVSAYVDWIEAGTPLIKRYGMVAVERLRATCPTHVLVADMKTMDAGQWEARLAFGAGADLITVLACADNATIQAAVEEADRQGKRVCADLLGVPDVVARAQELATLGVHMLGVHAGSDQQTRGYDALDALQRVRRALDNTPLAVAGGIHIRNVRSYLNWKPAVVVIGSGITAAADPLTAARQFQQEVRNHA